MAAKAPVIITTQTQQQQQYPLGFAIKVDAIAIAGSLFAVSAITLIRPDLTPSIIFFLLGITLLVVDIPSSFIQPIMRQFTIAMNDSIQEDMMIVASKKASKESLSSSSSSKELHILQHPSSSPPPLISFLQTLADATIQILDSSHVQGLHPSIKSYVVSVMKDDELQMAFMDTLQKALLHTLEDSGDGGDDNGKSHSLLETIPLVVQKAIVQALSNEHFVAETTQSIVSAIVAASQQPELTDNMMDVITRSVSCALEDDRFVSELKNAMKETLRDGSIYRAGAKGVLSAVVGGGKSSSDSSGSSGSVVKKKSSSPSKFSSSHL